MSVETQCDLVRKTRTCRCDEMMQDIVFRADNGMQTSNAYCSVELSCITSFFVEALNILIADDSIEIGRRLRRLLLRIHFVQEVRCCHSFDAVKRAFVERKPDLLVLDHHFPEGHGVHLLTDLGDKIEAVHVIIYSAYANTMESRRYDTLGVYAIIDKSAPVDHLIDTLARIDSERHIAATGR